MGEFLRARRQAVTVDDVGLPDSGRRRTPGLRRDEVAQLAGVSADYYVRLEQGRELHPSDQVLAALARALRLNVEAAEHLHALANPRPSARRPGSSRQVDPNVVRLIDGWHRAPALVTNDRLDVLARNALGGALYEGLDHADNLLRLTFLNPDSRRFYPDWEREASSKVANLRAMAGPRPDPSLLTLVEELSRESEDFRRIWARHDVRARTQEFRRLVHREVGELNLWHATFSIDGSPGQRIFVAQADPGSRSEDALQRLSVTHAVGR
ncbi:helix-turn-helix transcriptional regulator [Planotetraspora phitsanulokensis]|uniref:Transcriptional regulator n=1 Tax=Planotetraspora phitsanulokensis TaxID=575192 RepID=A0A8J3U3K8_9ACTN|nr:transcriptional regulator [Planotetraspora phitsanulokensis]